MENFLSIAALADKYPVSKSLIYAACQGGLIRHYRVPARNGNRGKYLIREGDFMDWLEQHRVERTAAPSPPVPHITQ